MKKILFTLSVILSLTACSDDEIASPEIGLTEPDGGYTIDKMQWLRIQPEVKNANDATFSWSLEGEEIAATANLVYVFAEAGTYNLEFKAKNAGGENAKIFSVTVNEKTYLNKITQVFDFLPAPGQSVNKLPAAIDKDTDKATKDTDETMRVKAETSLTSNSMVSLGGFGGYVVFGFDHTVVNKEGNDFIVKSNALATWAEPGTIMVSYDANGNGKADDEWYEIAGSEYNKETTIKNYEMTYYKPETEPTNASEPNYIRWTDNQGQTGYISKNSFNRQAYYPVWKGATITFKGTFLKSNIAGSGNSWSNLPYEWGYSDNWANTNEKAQINIDWAVDKDGNAVKLQGIDFVKVYTSNRAEGGWLGEVSTEVSGFTDLNLP
ncbi:PKD-like domain-containing protein [Flavobacterium sp. FBOR7N2.3]|uniref:PKD-like domain-containing protein n=1 Tax=Flavobacterium magnesitis TaxID=3138077 RepID=A0ABV4TN42_9FLAO